MKIRYFKTFMISFVFISACTTTKTVNKSTSETDQIGTAKLMMAAYQQKAAEYKALCYQAYNIARYQVDEKIKQVSEKPKAIMTDIDETVLDNSPYQVHQSLMGKDFDQKSWYDWTRRGDADTVPGALHFFQYAASKGIEIFYVTNRDENERQSTLENLKKFGFPFANNEHLLLKQTSSSKTGRRDSIAAYKDIILFIGDNLNDLNGSFEKKSMSDRSKVTDSYAQSFGDNFIVLPNASYGDWENAFYQYNYKLTPAQKDSVLRSITKSY